jgi:hypothetical protein
MGNKAQTGGILTIISGSVGLLGSLLAFAFIPLIRSMLDDPAFTQDANLTAAEIEMLNNFMSGFVAFWGIIGLALSVFVIIAGVMVTRRKAWGLGLAGSIVSLFLFFPTAIPAIVFMAMARPEFSPPQPLVVTIATPVSVSIPPVPPASPPAPPPPPAAPAP